jgi:hypothetical protein
VGHWYLHNSLTWVYERDGIYFAAMDGRLVKRYHQLVKEHEHVLNAAASGLSALPGTRQSFASTQAMWRFLNNDAVSLPALIEPIHETARPILAQSRERVALIAHDWSMLNYGGHSSKTDRYQRTHKTDLGYELATALLIEADRGMPLGPMEIRLRTANGVLTTRPGGAKAYRARLDELVDVMDAARNWALDRSLVHIIDREADSVWHYRRWDAAGHQFVVRADDARCVRWKEVEQLLPAVAEALRAEGAFADTGKTVDYEGTTGRLQVAETKVVLDRAARRTIEGKKKEIPGKPITLRLVICRVVDVEDHELAMWLLLTNVSESHDAATVVQWYYWRWRIETYYKLLKSAGQQVEKWEQESGEAIAKRLVIASMSCLVVWTLQRDESPTAAELRRVLVRLSGRQMKHKVESTAPALLAGLEKLLAMLDLLEQYDIADLRRLARAALPILFDSS